MDPASTRSFQTAAAWCCFGTASLLLIILPPVIEVVSQGENSTVGILWHGPESAACHVTDPNCSEFVTGLHWCEGVQWNHLHRTKFNTFSNVGFVIAGLCVFTLATTFYYGLGWNLSENHSGEEVKIRFLRKNHLHEKYGILLSMIYAVGLCLGGITSYYSHMSVTSVAREVDRFGIWCMFVPATGFALMRFFDYPKPPIWYACYISALVLGVSAGGIIHFGFGREPFTTPMLFVGIVFLAAAIILTVPLRYAMDKWGREHAGFKWNLQPLESQHMYAILAVVFAAVAFLCQDPERIGVPCDGDSPWFQNTHGFWHIFMAIALFLLWLFVWTGEYQDAEVKLTDEKVDSPRL